MPTKKTVRRATAAKPAKDARRAAKPAAKRAAPPAAGERMTVTTVNQPDYTHEVDAVRYRAMHAALLKVMPTRAPGFTQGEMWAAAAAHVPKALFPDRGKVAWWAKTVQLDQEAKGAWVREAVKPLRWHVVAKR